MAVSRAAAAAAAATVFIAAVFSTVPVQEAVNVLFMRFFRDLSRAKARARLNNPQSGLVPLLLGQEEPMEVQEPPEDALLFTLEELADFDGSVPGVPLYIAVQVSRLAHASYLRVFARCHQGILLLLCLIELHMPHLHLRLGACL